MRGVASYSGSGERGRLAGQREEHAAARCDGKSKERERKRREKRRRGAAPREGSEGGSEKGKNERGGETGKRDEAEIQKVLTS